MPRVTEFVTPETANQYEIVIKKSRFIGHLVPVTSVEEAEAALNAIRLEHKTATHNCYAYRVGLGVPVERFSDDGEPSGTAGRPILEVLRRRPIHNALVVVTRYFGGTLLGANGLVHAYTDATVEVLNHTPLLTCRRMVLVSVRLDYSHYGKFEYELAQRNLAMLDPVYAEDVSFQVRLPEEDVPEFLQSVADWSNGQAECVTSEAEFVGIRPDGGFVLNVWPHAADQPES
ncbi:YigZ family protein [Alicyclobacillus contaminans]|uniref:YigZ family protein n=1 Tax=Alicyclobacillus contaminans TaxID=392016 RepID=UPI00041A3159|nr:YigZ family protein [Alicyclobacillus contaminans]GMA50994.1 YigZ family protein [Alicyclobacillus contaminans]